MLPIALNLLEVRPQPRERFRMSASAALPSPRVDLDALFRRYHRELNAFAYGRLKSREAAADIVQDAYLRCLQSEALAEALNPQHYLKRVVGNLTIDAIRQGRRRGIGVPIADVAESLADPAPCAERALAARQDYAAVCRALDALPPPERTCLLLSRVEGLTHAQIAARLGVSASLVSKHIMSALRHCLRRLPHLG